MANRMLSTKIIASDRFLELSFAEQALYMRLCTEADDDGFLNNAKGIALSIGIPKSEIENALKTLTENKFLIEFRGNIYCIKHWLIHNSIRADRKRDTQYQTELSMLYIKENGAYTLNSNKGKRAGKQNCQPNDNHLTTICQPSDNHLTTICQPSDNHLTTICQPNVRIRQDKIRQDKIIQDNINTHPLTPSTDEGILSVLTAKQIDTLEKTYGTCWYKIIDEIDRTYKDVTEIKSPMRLAQTIAESLGIQGGK